MPLWNTETLHVHDSFISRNFVNGWSPTVKEKDLYDEGGDHRERSRKEYAVSVRLVSRPARVCDAQHELHVSAVFLERHPVKTLATVSGNRTLVES